MKCLILVVVSAITLTITTKSQSWTYYDTSNSILPNSSIIDLVSCPITGNILCFSSSLIQIDGSIWSSLSFCGAARYAVDSKDTIWSVQVDYGLGSIKLNKDSLSNCITYYNNDLEIHYYEPIEIYIDKFNNKWIGTWSATGSSTPPYSYTYLSKFDNIVWKHSTLPGNGGYISCIIGDNNNLIWIGKSTILYKYNGTTWSYYNSSNSNFPLSIVHSLAVDANNNKWIGTENGLVKFDDTTFTLTADLGFPVCQVNDIEIDRFGVLWCATTQGLVRYDGVSAYTYNTSNTTLPSNNMKFAAIDGNDNIWLAFNTINGVAKCEGLITGSPKIKDKSPKLQVYPNPSGKKIKISISSHAKETGVSIYNISGSEVFKEQYKANEIEINTESFQKGVYLIKVSSGNEVFNEKMIIN